MDQLILFCRAGFEAETAAEIIDRAQEVGVYGYPKTREGSGFVSFISSEAEGGLRLIDQLPFQKLCFARQWFATPGPVLDLPAEDRISTLLAALKGFPRCGELVVEMADTNEAKQLAKFCRKFTSPCAAALRRQGVLSDKRNRRLPRLHLFFLDSSEVFPGISYPDNSSPEVMGIPRLKFPAEAPSRSTLKLDEAFLTFLSERERERLLQPGMTAVDLGAAPGGWTWQLVRRHFRVTAVDNGPMADALMESGLVEHVREDGFRFRPQKTVDWMVCDIADQPSKVARLAASWILNQGCRYTIFNLKLPMKKRYQAVQEASALIHELLGEQAVRYRLDIRHLYHDREEVTCCLRPLAG